MIRSLNLARAWDVPKRYIRIELWNGRRSDAKSYKRAILDVSYKISFQTSETVSGAVNELNLELNGLTVDNMLYYATTYNQFHQNPVFNDIVVTAGYDNFNGIIFEGNITEAIPDMNTADYSLRLKAISWYEEMNNEIKSYSYQGETPVNKILQDIASRQGMLLQSQIGDDISVTDFTLNNVSFIQTLRELSTMKGIDIWSVNGRIFAKQRGEPLEEISPITIDERNMIGIPTPTNIGCDVSIKLNPAIVTGQFVRLKSKKFPQLNTYSYNIQTLSHGGDTKSNKWQTNLHLIRTDIYKD